VDPVKEGVVLSFIAVGPRTGDGDFDFGRTDAATHWRVLEFEFDAAVMALRAADRSQKYQRLLNLARYRGFHTRPANRAWLETLMSESELSAAQRQAVLEVFRASAPTAQR
jgi:hypothetical protein